jgi:hypothetical protein
MQDVGRIRLNTFSRSQLNRKSGDNAKDAKKPAHYPGLMDLISKELKVEGSQFCFLGRRAMSIYSIRRMLA